MPVTEGENSGKTLKPRGRPFPKGVSGNPNGRPLKEWTWRSLIEEALEEEEEGIPVKQIISRKLVGMGKSGDLGAIKEIGDRIDGKPSQGVELSGKNGGKIEHSIRVVFQ